VLWVPLTGFGPLQAPDASQPVALAELQVNVAALPLATAAGEAPSVTDGTTCSVMLALAPVLLGPVQSNE
jgi:hypothetical protein